MLRLDLLPDDIALVTHLDHPSSSLFKRLYQKGVEEDAGNDGRDCLNGCDDVEGNDGLFHCGYGVDDSQRKSLCIILLYQQ